MPNKLQELTDKLYNEGLSRGKEEGENILAKARKQAEEIVAKANEQASSIIAKAEKDALDMKSKAESDIRMASAQSLQATRKDIEDLLVSSVISGKLSSAMTDVDFIKEMVRAVAQRFSTEESADMSMVLPAAMQKEIEPWLGSELGKLLKTGVSASFSKKIQGGFTIGPKDGSWFVSLTDETFKELIAEYLRPVTRKLLFG